MNLSCAIRRALLPFAICASVNAFAQAQTPTTPITNVVVLFQENVSFDHYFGTYPNSQNNSGEQAFMAYPGTPTVNGLSPELLLTNPNFNALGTAKVNPPRLTPAQAYTCSQNHNYGPEQQALDGGLMDQFPKFVGRTTSEGCAVDGSTNLGYYDGNTVTAFWNYAQNYSMNDNSFGSTFGPSTTGALNLIAGQTYGGLTYFGTGSTASYPNSVSVSPTSGTATGAVVTDIGDFDPYLDDCGSDQGGSITTTTTLQMNGDASAQTGNKNIGDLLNAKGITWGWFGGGFLATTPATFNANGTLATPAICGKGRTLHMYPSNATYIAPNSSSSASAVVVANPVAPLLTGADIHTPTYGADGVGGSYATPATGFYTLSGKTGNDYVPHHEPFQFYASTRNPHHLPPTAAIGASDQANHQYDTSNFFQALGANQLPAVSFIKAPYAYNGHAGNSDPVTEQYWIAQVVNQIMQSSAWAGGGVAIIIAYDDSDGWYDHVMGPVVSPSNVTETGQASTYDNIAGVGNCGTPAAGANPARCGHGPRLPLVVISPYANSNYVDHTLTNQTSIIKFIETNWNLGFIDGPTAPANGQGSFDRYAGSLTGLFNFNNPPSTSPVLLTCAGAVAAPGQACPIDPNP